MKVPPWGWPWHGRVDTAGNLYLPNGQTVPYPGPAGHSSFFTYRVRVPGVLPVTRSSEELAADTAAGREWRDEAILGGTTLYGRNLAGWVYCAPDGTKWDIWTQPSLLTPEKWIEARRFGVLGGKREVKELRLKWPTDDLIEGERRYYSEYGYYTPIRWRVPVDISPDGSRAIYMLYATEENLPSNTHSLFQRVSPIGFQLLTLSGGRDNMQVTVTTLRTFEQTLGEAFADDALTVERWLNNSRRDHTEPKRADVNRPWPDPPDTEYWSGVGVWGPWDDDPGGQYTYAQGTVSRGVEGRILALWFDPAGEIVECTVRTEESYNISLDHPTSAQDPDDLSWDRWTQIKNATSTQVAELLVGDEVVCTYSEEWVASSLGWEGDDEFAVTNITRDDDDTYSLDGFGIWGGVLPNWLHLPSLKNKPSVYSLKYAGLNYWRILTNNVVVFARYDTINDSDSGIQYHGCATPRGVVPMSGTVPGKFTVDSPAGPLRHARYNPFTGEVSDPVGDTATFV